MKEASGELNMTVVTIVAIAAVLGFFWAMWPTIKKQVANNWGEATVTDEKGNKYTHPEDAIPG